MAKWTTMAGDAKTDDFQTPPPVCDYMCNMIPLGARVILEPTRGEGNLVRAIQKIDAQRYDPGEDEGLYISAPDNFFTMNLDKRFDSIVMNPPFSTRSAFGYPEDLGHDGMRLGYYILTRCMKMSDSVIALMPWFTITDSDVRMRYIKDFGLKSITALPRKTFSYARIQTCIFEMHKGWKEETIFRTFDF